MIAEEDDKGRGERAGESVEGRRWEGRKEGRREGERVEGG